METTTDRSTGTDRLSRITGGSRDQVEGEGFVVVIGGDKKKQWGAMGDGSEGLAIETSSVQGSVKGDLGDRELM